MAVRERLSLEWIAAVFLLGLCFRLLIDWANHHGPSGDGWSLQGNGALVFVPLVLIALLAAEIVAAWRKKWIDIPVLPLAMALGLIAGGVFSL